MVSIPNQFENIAPAMGHPIPLLEPEESDQLENTSWWLAYGNETLNKMVDTLLANNLELKAAGERLIQARERRGQQAGQFFPTIGLEYGASRAAEPLAGGGFINALAGGGGGTAYFNNYDLDVTSSWQMDIFGRIRNATRAADAAVNANAADRIGLAHSLITELINQYVQITTLRERKKFLEQVIDNRQVVLETAERLYATGTQAGSAQAVRIAREAAVETRASLPQIDAQIREAAYALDILLGQTPKMQEEDLAPLSAPLPLTIPPPMALLDRRPDIQGAGFRVLAAQYDVDAAVSNLFPNLSIGTAYGFGAGESGNLIGSDQIAWNLLGSIAQPIFQGGQLRAERRVQESEKRELMTQYQHIILTSIQEVETALITEKKEFERLGLLNTILREAQANYESAERRYRTGLVTLPEVLDTQRRLYDLEQTILLSKQTLWQARLNLMLALGGEWVPALATADKSLKEKDLKYTAGGIVIDEIIGEQKL